MLPDTGASSITPPAAAAWLASVALAAGSIVLISTMTAPGRRPSSSPPDPATTSSTAAVSVTMEKITSAARATSAADCSSTIPLATRSFVLPGVRFQPWSSCPAARRRAAIRLPMEPRPTNPRVGLADGVDNLGREAVEAAQELAALAVQALDLALVLVQAPLRL